MRKATVVLLLVLAPLVFAQAGLESAGMATTAEPETVCPQPVPDQCGSALDETSLLQRQLEVNQLTLGKAQNDARIARQSIIILGLFALMIAGVAVWLFRSQRQHRNRAHTDYLTGIANRGHIFTQGFKIGDRALKKDELLSVVLLDLDHFKKINDTLGHDAGDRALIAAVTAMKAPLHRGEILGRLGGEEFVAILPGIGQDEALQRAEAMREAVANAGFLHAGKHPVNFTVSLGVSVIDPSCDFQTLVNRADEALYVAKNSGRNRVVLASSTAERLSSGTGIVGSRQATREVRSFLT